MLMLRDMLHKYAYFAHFTLKKQTTRNSKKNLKFKKIISLEYVFKLLIISEVNF